MENANVANRIHLTKDTQMASNLHVNKSEQRKKKGPNQQQVWFASAIHLINRLGINLNSLSYYLSFKIIWTPENQQKMILKQGSKLEAQMCNLTKIWQMEKKH